MDVESEHVHKVYSKIATHFSDTRFKPWPRIADFLREQPVGSLIADVGCGNGKYLGVNPSTYCLGSDICPELVTISCQRGHQVSVCDCLHLPYRSGVFDAVICIAVVHHLSTEERRLSALREMGRILKSGGHMLVYVWAMEQVRKKFDSQDVMVPWHLQPKYIPGASQAKPSGEQAMKTPRDNCKDRQKLRKKKRQKKEQKQQQKVKRDSTLEPMHTDESRYQKHTLTEKSGDDTRNDVACLFSELSSLDLSDEDLGLPQGASEAGNEIKTNTQTWTNTSTIPDTIGATEAIIGPVNSRHEPMLSETEISHKSPILSDGVHDTTCNKHGLREQGYQTFQRYYHVFRHGELLKLFSKTDGLEVVDEFFDHENWCVIAKKN